MNLPKGLKVALLASLMYILHLYLYYLSQERSIVAVSHGSKARDSSNNTISVACAHQQCLKTWRKSWFLRWNVMVLYLLQVSRDEKTIVMHLENESTFQKWKQIPKMNAYSENESTFWKRKHILKIKAHFKNESTFREYRTFWKWEH